MATTVSNEPPAGAASFFYRSVAPVSTTFSALGALPGKSGPDQAAGGSPPGESGPFDDYYNTTDFKLYSLKVRELHCHSLPVHSEEDSEKLAAYDGSSVSLFVPTTNPFSRFLSSWGAALQTRRFLKNRGHTFSAYNLYKAVRANRERTPVRDLHLHRVIASLATQVLPCTKRYCHAWALCPFAHQGEKARRRDVRVYQYAGIACPDMKKVRTIATGTELFCCAAYHSCACASVSACVGDCAAQFTNTRCNSLQNFYCPRGDLCSYAHNVSMPLGSIKEADEIDNDLLEVGIEVCVGLMS
jgi:hypothetical protein